MKSSGSGYLINEKFIKSTKALVNEDNVAKLRKQLNENRPLHNNNIQQQSRLKHNSFSRQKVQNSYQQNTSFDQQPDNSSKDSHGRVSVSNVSVNSGVSKARLHTDIIETVLTNSSQKNHIMYKLKKMISEPNEFFKQESPQRHQQKPAPHLNSRSFTGLRSQAIMEQLNLKHLDPQKFVKDEGSTSCYIKYLDKPSLAGSINMPQSNKAAASDQLNGFLNMHKKTNSMNIKKSESVPKNEKITQMVQQLKILEQTVEKLKVDQLHYQKASQSQQEFGKNLVNQKLGKKMLQCKQDLKQLTSKLKSDQPDSALLIVPKELIETLNHVFDSIFEFQEIACIQILLEMLVKNTELSQELEKQRVAFEKLQVYQEEQLKQMQEQIVKFERQKTFPDISQIKHHEVDMMKDSELREFTVQLYDKLQVISEKEAKLIKLVMAIKNSGVDIEKIYNEEVLNDDDDVQSFRSTNHKFKPNRNLSQSFNLADNSIINDSEESSMSYFHRNVNESILESIRQHKVANPKVLLDLTKVKPNQL